MSPDENTSGTPIVVDIGTYSTKIGFAGEATPRAVVRSLMGMNPKTKNYVFGDEVLPLIDQLKLKKPIFDGVLINEALRHFPRFLEYLITHVLECRPSDHPLLLLTNGKGLQEWDDVASHVFQHLDVPSLKIMKSSQPCLFALGRSTAMIVQVGAGHTIACPFMNGYATAGTCPRLYLGSQKDVDALIHQELVKRNVLPDTLGGLELARQVKEQVAYTAQDYEAEMAEMASNPNPAVASLPNGLEIECGPERILGPEVFFNPGLHGHTSLVGLHIVVRNSVTNCQGIYRAAHADFRNSDEDLQRELASHIYLVGGHARLPGFAQRMEKEIAAMLPNFTVSVQIPDRSSDFEWFGGALVADQGNLCWVSKQAWLDAGKSYSYREY